MIAHHDVIIEPNDHLILFRVDKRQLRHVEQMFRADATAI